MGYSPTEYAEFTEPPTEMSSHGFHRFTQILRVRCSPTEFTEFTEFGSVGMAGMPYPPTSVLICVIRGRLFSARSFCAFRAFCGNLFPPTDFSLGGYGILPYPRRLLWDILPRNTPNSQNLLLRCPPTDFTDLHRYLGCAVLPQNTPNSQNLAAWVWQGCHTLLHLCASVLICGRLFSARSFCAFRAFCGNIFPPTEFTESTEPPTGMSSHGFHGFTQILRVRCSPTEFVSVGMAGMPYPPTSVRIRAICGRLFSARGSVCSVYSVGASSPLVRLVQQRQLYPLAESTEVVCTSHHLTTSPSHHNNIISPRTQPSACPPSTVGTTSSLPAAR